MQNNPYYTGSMLGGAIEGFLGGMGRAEDRALANRKMEQEIARQAQLMQIAATEEQRKADEVARVTSGRNYMMQRFAPQPLVDGNIPTALGEGLLSQVPEFNQQTPSGPYDEPNAPPMEQVRNPQWDQMLATIQQQKSIPAAPLTVQEALAHEAKFGDPGKVAAHVVSYANNDAKLQNLRDMLELKNSYGQQMQQAKNEYEQKVIQQKYENAVALQQEKYDLLKAIKIASANGPVKAPSGYRYNGDALEPIPGGPADVKGQDRAKKAEGAMMFLDTSIKSLEDLMTHPGRLGATGTLKTSFIPGTDAADWAAKLDTFKAQTFVPMVESMKGMGALSDAEGKKLTDAVGALDRSRMSEKGMMDSMGTILRELQLKKQLAEKYMPQSNYDARKQDTLDLGTATRLIQKYGSKNAAQEAWDKGKR